jgi:dTDP-4-amino-4,6-dideoxygalactose transaminase
MAGLRHVAPAGAPITLADLGAWAGACFLAGAAEARLHDEVTRQFGVRHCFSTSTGRAGLTLLLRALRQLATADRDEVVIPAYTCYSVAASVVKAGLRPRIVDVLPGTLDFDPEALERSDFSRVLAVIATNLYGIPNDLPALATMARARGAFLIDDAAQAMGASVGGRWSGTWGDAGLFSFDKGKSIAAIDGGLVVTDSTDIATAMREEMKGLAAPGAAASSVLVAKAVAYSALLRPSLYGIPARIPQLELGKTIFSTDFPLERPSLPLVALAGTMMRRLAEFSSARRRNAELLRARLEQLPGLRTPQVMATAHPTFVRLPVLLPTRAARETALTELNRLGIGATGSYPQSLVDVPELQGRMAQPEVAFPGGRAVANRILTLPTHPYVTASDVDTATAALSSVLRATLAPSRGLVIEPHDRPIG